MAGPLMTASAIRRASVSEAAVLLERSIDEIAGPAWDRFAIACGGSFLGSWGVVKAEYLLHTVRVFEFYTPATPVAQKVGQCAVVTGGGRVRFLDRIHVLPTHAELWASSLNQVIARCGPALYVYGSLWNHETPPATLTTTALPAGRFVDKSFRLDSVVFAKWPTFPAYRRQISENIRRDYKKALAASPTVVTRRGAAACRDVPALVELRRQVMRRNDEPFSVLVDAPTHVVKLLCLGDDAFITTVRANGEAQAAFFGVRFGDGLYYLGGGTRDRCEGFGSYLFLTLIEEGFAQHPQGTLYLGVEEPGFTPQTYTHGNLLYRRKLRAGSVDATAFTLQVG
jgi:hypothetical protein